MDLLDLLREEKSVGRKGGLYHHSQILFAYNSNRIEGSRLSHEQTRFIYETNTFLPESENEIIHTDDVLETLNHFKAFDYLLEVADQPLSEEIIFRFHAILKQGTSDDRNPDFVVGGYKKFPNMIGASVETVPPEQVPLQMKKLIQNYVGQQADEQRLIDFHYNFEKIHPFQDGNGRVGRLILFKECLFHKLVPFVIDSEHKLFYYRGLREYPREHGFLIDTCLSAQDFYKDLISYYKVDERKPFINTTINDAATKASTVQPQPQAYTRNNPER